MRRLVLYAHWDPGHRVKRYVTHALERLRGDCDRLVFSSTAGLPPEEVQKVRQYVDEVRQRENFGFDFAMWRDALDATDVRSWDEIVITNSSVVGPIYPLRPIFDRMTATGCDFWGMTESVMFATHLQSYFLVFRKALLCSNVFGRFWKSVLPFRDKMQVVRSYELGLTRYFHDEGFRYAALVGHVDLASRLRRGRFPHQQFGRLYRARRRIDATVWQNHKKNPTYLYPLELLDLGMPFVKYELFRDNARRFPLERVYETLEKAGYPRSLIVDG